MMSLYAMLILIPFTQLGVTYYISVAGIGSILVFFTGRRNVNTILYHNITPRLLIVGLMIISSVFYIELDFEILLVSIRESVFFFLITGVAYCSIKKFSNEYFSRISKILLCISIGMATLVLFQYVWLSSGQYLGIPSNFFVQNADALPTELDLKFSKIRPMGTFGEPSYLGGVCFSLIFAIGSAFSKSKICRYVSLILIGIIIISNSLFAFVSAIILFSFNIWAAVRSTLLRAGIILAVVSVFALVLVLDTFVSQRVSNFGTMRDASAMARIINPLSVIPDVLSDHPGGIPRLAFSNMPFYGRMALDTKNINQNGLLNFIINFGFVGVVVIFGLLTMMKDARMRIYVFLYTIQNGAFLSIDKFYIFSFSVILYNSIQSILAVEAGESAARPEPEVRFRVSPRFRRATRGEKRGLSSLRRTGLVLPLAAAGFAAPLFAPAPGAAKEWLSIRVSAGQEAFAFDNLTEALGKACALRQSRMPGEVVVALPPGVLRPKEPLRVDSGCSGNPDGALVIRGSAGGPSIVSGARLASPHPAPADKLSVNSAAAGILAVDLPTATPILPRGPYVKAKGSGFDLYQGARTLSLARWPRTGFTTDVDVSTTPEGDFRLAFLGTWPGPRDWGDGRDIWLGGYWGYDWAYETVPVIAGLAPGVFVVRKTVAAFPPRRSPRVFAENVLAELRDPGQFVVDTARGIALIRPFGNGADLEVSHLEHVLILDGASRVRIENVGFEKSLSATVEIRNARDVALADCYVGQSGSAGIVVEGGANVSISQCVVRHTADSGIEIRGGDRNTLSASGHRVERSVIRDFALLGRDYRSGIRAEGVGITIVGNTVSNGLASGIILGGNDHLVEGNEIHDVLQDSDDAGAIYMGRDWTQRGMVVRNNYVHDIGFGLRRHFIVGVYLDDLFSGVAVKDNIIDRVGIGVVIGGGRDNDVTGNAFADAELGGVFFDSRGTWKRFEGIRKDVKAKFERTPVGSAAWQARYPGLDKLMGEDPFVPKGNLVRQNIVIDSVLFAPKGEAVPGTSSADNTIIKLASADLDAMRGCLRQRRTECDSLSERALGLKSLVAAFAALNPARTLRFSDFQAWQNSAP